MKVNRKLLKVLTIVTPALFVGLFEWSRHTLFTEHHPMLLGNILIIISVGTGSYFFSKFIFGIMEKAEEESRQRNKELAALNSVAAAVNESLNLDVVLYRALDKVLQVTDSQAGEIFLLDERTHEVVQKVHAGLFPEAFQEKTKFQIGEGLPGIAVQSGLPIVVPDLSQDPRFVRAKIKDSGAHSFAIVPLKAKGSIIGAMSVARLSVDSFTAEDTQLLTNMGNYIGLSIENAQLHQEVQGIAALEERERIAREMHDSLAQVLSYVNAKSQAARQFLSRGESAQGMAQLIELENITQEVYADVREVILGLRSVPSPERDIASTLKDYVSLFTRMSGVKTQLEITDGRLSSLPVTTEVQVLRIIQESLTNVRKHAKATQAWVRVLSDNGKVEIVIEDNGQGFATSHIRRGEWPQFGLQTMKERAESVGGTLDIDSAAGKGTRVVLRVPVMRRKEYESTAG
ncbi:MAG: GAF domain-containing sensor histidine kinase [Chloroflexi bacterium]|nr:GAF domain-containing sensor histidine kinase [Chloroflexota bacterium]